MESKEILLQIGEKISLFRYVYRFEQNPWPHGKSHRVAFQCNSYECSNGFAIRIKSHGNNDNGNKCITIRLMIINSQFYLAKHITIKRIYISLNLPLHRIGTLIAITSHKMLWHDSLFVSISSKIIYDSNAILLVSSC